MQFCLPAIVTAGTARATAGRTATVAVPWDVTCFSCGSLAVTTATLVVVWLITNWHEYFHVSPGDRIWSAAPPSGPFGSLTSPAGPVRLHWSSLTLTAASGTSPVLVTS